MGRGGKRGDVADVVRHDGEGGEGDVWGDEVGGWRGKSVEKGD